MIHHIFSQCIKNLMIHKLIRIISIIDEHIDTSTLEMLKDRCGATCGARLTVLALADDIKSVLFCLVDKLGKLVSFGKIGFYRQIKIRKYFGIKVVERDLHHTVALARKINGLIIFKASAPATNGIVKADNGGIFYLPLRQQFFYGFS